jgi:uncharacterized protein
VTGSGVQRPAQGRGLAGNLVELCDELRSEGVTVGPSELVDAFDALSHVGWTSQKQFREALATTLAKSQDERRIFELVFDRFFFRGAEREAQQRNLQEPSQGQDIDLEQLKERAHQALRHGSDSELRDIARLAIAAFNRSGEQAGVVGVDLQRIRRGLGVKSAAQTSDANSQQGNIKRFERHLRRELERGLIERTGTLPPARPLKDLDRALPNAPLANLSDIHRVVAQLRRRLATQGHQHRGRRRSAVVDIRHTMRASLETGGVPLRLKYRPRRPKRPELYVLCDVSTSVSSASVFFLSVLHALHNSFRKLRSFVFIERAAEVTDSFEHNRSFRQISQEIATHAGVSDVSGYTDYGRVWLELLDNICDDLDPRSTLIVLGDARTNGRRPEVEVFARLSSHAAHTFWLNPEPQLYWNYGDSVMGAYSPYCDGVFECWTAKQLETFVNSLAKLSIP